MCALVSECDLHKLSQNPALEKVMRVCASVQESLPWTLALFFSLAMALCALKPSFLIDDERRFRRLGVSDPETTSIFAAPTLAFVVAVVSVFLPLTAAVANIGSVSTLSSHRGAHVPRPRFVTQAFEV